MNWVTASLLMFVSSVALYLVVRKATLLKIPTHITNLAMFAIPLAFFVILHEGTGEPYTVTLSSAAILLLAGVFFAFGGNTASLRAIREAPNPGYSLVLSKSYVLFTTVVALILFNAELSAQKALGILLIVGFSSLIMVDPAKTKKIVKKNHWLSLSMGAFFAWGMLSLSAKYLFNAGLGTYTFLLYLYLIVTICILVKLLFDRQKLHHIMDHKWVLLFIGIFSTTFNLFQFEAIKLAPNIGYVNAMNAGSIALVAVLAALVFKDDFSIKKFIGVVGVIGGIILLLI
jgi:drug/metabolite transporter (DMT)-like permease